MKKDLQQNYIFVEELYKNQFYFYNKTFKVIIDSRKGKKRNNFYFEFEIKDEKYMISFDSKGKTFIYEGVTPSFQSFYQRCINAMISINNNGETEINKLGLGYEGDSEGNRFH